MKILLEKKRAHDAWAQSGRNLILSIVTIYVVRYVVRDVAIRTKHRARIIRARPDKVPATSARFAVESRSHDIVTSLFDTFVENNFSR